MKRTLKAVLNGACLCAVAPVWFLYRLLALFGRGDSSFAAVSQALSLAPGVAGSYVRRAFYRLAMTRCSADCVIQFGTIFAQVDTEIGSGVYIGANCNIGTCRIEDHCTLGSNVHILSGRHQHNFDSLDLPIQDQGGVFEKIVIGEDAWIGNCAVVMANVGRKCVVGAGAVVTKDVEDYAIVAGNPARVVGHRGGRGG